MITIVSEAHSYNKVNFKKWDCGVKTSPFFTYIVSILKQVQVSLLYSFWKRCGSAWLGFELSFCKYENIMSIPQLWEPNICWCLVLTIQTDYCRKAIRRCPLLDEDTWFSLIILMSQYAIPNARIGKSEMSAMNYLGKSTPLSFPYSIL
jgi:hypothetical protein